MRAHYFGFGDSATTFQQELLADGLDPTLANPQYWTQTQQDEYHYFKSKGGAGRDPWRFANIASMDKGAIRKALDNGVLMALVSKAMDYALWMGGSEPRGPMATAILAAPADKDTLSKIIADALLARGATLPTQYTAISNQGGNVTPTVTDNTPSGGTTTTTGGQVVQNVGPNTIPNCTGTVEQCNIPYTDPYWLFPSGDRGSGPPLTPGATAAVAAASAGNAKSFLPWLIGGAAALFAMSKMK